MGAVYSTDSRGLIFELRIQDHNLTRPRLFRRRSGILTHRPVMGRIERRGYKIVFSKSFTSRSPVLTLLFI